MPESMCARMSSRCATVKNDGDDHDHRDEGDDTDPNTKGLTYGIVMNHEANPDSSCTLKHDKQH